MQVFFQALGSGQHSQDAQAFVVVNCVDAFAALQALLQPFAFSGVREVQVFDTDRLAIDLFTQLDDVAQLHPVWRDQRAAVEFPLQVGPVKIMVSEIEIDQRFMMRVAEWAETRFS